MRLMATAVVLVLGFVNPLAALAQTVGANRVFGRYQQFAWQEQHGLPQTSVLAIAATRDGYVWVGTHEGVARFDGVRFTPFTTANTAALGNPMVDALLEDRAGNLWIATYGGGLTRFDHGRFSRFTTADGLTSNFIVALVEDREGNVWIGTDGAGLSRWRDGRFTRFTTEHGLPSNLVRAIADDGDGGLWIGTSGGIARLNGERITVIDDPPALRHLNVHTLGRAADGALWVSALSGGLYRVADGRATRFGPQDGLTHDVIESLRADSSGEMWVGSSTGGLFRYAAGRFQRYSAADGLPGDRVPTSAEDSRGDRWVGTDGGLVRLGEPRLTVYTDHDGLPSDRVANIYQDPSRRVWVQSGSELVFFESGRFNRLTREQRPPGGRVRRIAADAGGNLLVLTEKALAGWTGERFVRLNDVDGVDFSRISAILRDRAGNVWLGIVDLGVVCLNGEERTEFTSRDGLGDDTILNLFEDRAGNIWVATLRGGITRIANGHLTSWSTKDGLADNHVKAFYEDAAGTLWIGTHGGGVSRFKDGTFSTIASRNGLYNDVVFRILEDDDGNLWMNSNRGIWRTSLEDMNAIADGRRRSVTSFAYGVPDGMLSSEGVGATLAGWKMREGTLWFPTIRGIVVVDPRRRDTRPPRVVIEGVTVDREPIAVDHTLELGPGHENVEIQYTGLTGSRPHEIRFRFRMDGLDREWVEAGTRRTAYYSHLSAGAYTFTVMADNGEGVWNTEGESLAVVVLPPIYRSWWFTTIAALGAIGMVGLGWHSRVTRPKRAHATRQEFLHDLMVSQERERQRIAAELHDGLGQRLVVVRNLATLSLEPSVGYARSRQYIEEIAAEAAAAINEVRGVSYNLRPYQLDGLGLRKAVEALIRTVASASRTAFTSEVGDIDHALPADQEISFYRVVQESLTNIVKHSQARTASVRIECNRRHLVMTIEDDGIGFVPNATGRDGRPGGFGLIGIYERVESLGGDARIHSVPSQGTTINVEIGLSANGHGR